MADTAAKAKSKAKVEDADDDMAGVDETLETAGKSTLAAVGESLRHKTGCPSAEDVPNAPDSRVEKFTAHEGGVDIVRCIECGEQVAIPQTDEGA